MKINITKEEKDLAQNLSFVGNDKKRKPGVRVMVNGRLVYQEPSDIQHIKKADSKGFEKAAKKAAKKEGIL